MHKQKGWPQAWEYGQAKPIQTLGRASQGVNWSWSQCIKSHHAPHAQTSSGKGLPNHFWNRNIVRSILPELRRKRTGLLLSGPKSSFQMKVNFTFNLEIKVSESQSGEVQNPCCLKSSVKFPHSVITKTKVCHKWRISTWRQPLQPWPSAESRTHRWAPETDLQWGPRHLDIHRGKPPGTSGPLTLWLCCSWNKLLICLAGGELAPRLSLVSPKVYSPFCHRWSFRSLPLSPLACLVGDTSFPAKSSTWLHRYYLNWTELDNAITKFNNEMHSADNWVLNLVILHYWHNLPIFLLCSALLQFVLLKALYK